MHCVLSWRLYLVAATYGCNRDVWSAAWCSRCDRRVEGGWSTLSSDVVSWGLVSDCLIQFLTFSPTLYQWNISIILPGHLSANILYDLSVFSRQIFLHILSSVSGWISSIYWRTSLGKNITIFFWTLQDNIVDILSFASRCILSICYRAPHSCRFKGNTGTNRLNLTRRQILDVATHATAWTVVLATTGWRKYECVVTADKHKANAMRSTLKSNKLNMKVT